MIVNNKCYGATRFFQTAIVCFGLRQTDSQKISYEIRTLPMCAEQAMPTTFGVANNFLESDSLFNCISIRAVVHLMNVELNGTFFHIGQVATDQVRSALAINVTSFTEFQARTRIPGSFKSFY